MDGIYIGVIWLSIMCNMMLLLFGVYIVVYYLLFLVFGNYGFWLVILIFFGLWGVIFLVFCLWFIVRMFCES